MPAAAPTLPILVTERLVHDRAALVAGADLSDALAEHRRVLAEPGGELVGPLAVAASAAPTLRALADPDGVLTVSLVADQGLLALQEARHALQDDLWITLDHVEIALPSGFAPADSTRALLSELAFTVPTYVELPRTGYSTALDVLAEDGVERATYRCGGRGADPVPTEGELASFVHGCVDRRVPFTIAEGLGRAVRGADGQGHHGSVNVLAAVAAALDGASTTDLELLLASTDVDALLRTVARAGAARIRASFHGFGSSDVAATLRELSDVGARGDG